MTFQLDRLAADRRGATAIEYGLIASIIVAGLVVVLPVLFDSMDGALYGPVIAFFTNL